MLHKVRLAHYVTYGGDHRVRAAFTEVMVEAEAGDSAAQIALETNRHLAFPRGPQQEFKVGVCGIETPTAQEVEAWRAGRAKPTEVHAATGHQDEFTARRDIDAPAVENLADAPRKRGRPRKVAAE